jgi:hypothetical protein
MNCVTKPKTTRQTSKYLALHHAFCFISYKHTEFKQYLAEALAQSEGD